MKAAETMARRCQAFQSERNVAGIHSASFQCREPGGMVEICGPGPPPPSDPHTWNMQLELQAWRLASVPFQGWTQCCQISRQRAQKGHTQGEKDNETRLKLAASYQFDLTPKTLLCLLLFLSPTLFHLDISRCVTRFGTDTTRRR